MAAHAKQPGPAGEKLRLGERARPAFMAAAIVAAVGLALSLVLGYGKDGGLRRFYFAYLFGYAFFLSIALGALFFVLMQHLTRAGWSVTVRRIGEAIAATIPVLGILSVPLLAAIAAQKGTPYPWALPLSTATPEAVRAAERGEASEAPDTNGADAVEHPTLDSVVLQKRAWLNPGFVIGRVVFYFAIWSWMALWYRKQSVDQDKSVDPAATSRMQVLSGICMLVLGLTLTGAAGDLIMSLDPHWFSTIFGVYYFAGSAVASFAVLIIAARLLQRAGYLNRSITVEHYHDLGKYLFGFTFFWGYIALSQYMLLWYANIPEEITWFERRGATTVASRVTGWSWVIVAILFGQLLVPFAGLMSRHVKRRPGVLLAWAVWALAFHLLDVYWLVMPQCPKFTVASIAVDLAAVVGIGGAVVATFLHYLGAASLRPIADPRLQESLAFQNV